MTQDTTPADVRRLNPYDRNDDAACMINEGNGQYVRYSDYAALSARLALSEGALDICSKAWGECNAQLDAANQRITELTSVVTLLPEG
jgi:hypothetical protein